MSKSIQYTYINSVCTTCPESVHKQSAYYMSGECTKKSIYYISGECT